MSLFATGRTTGTVVDSGYGITHTVPIYEGFAIPHATTEVPLCGQGLTEYMVQLWEEKARAPPRCWQVELGAEDLAEAEIFKIKYSRVASDYDAELKSANEGHGAAIDYKLPDGNTITVREELIRIPEMLFQPGLQNQSGEDGLQKHTFDSILKCEPDIKRDLFKNIVLAGGCTMFKGMQERMRKEITALAPSNMTPGVESPADRKYSCWLGGAILSQIKKFEDMWITKKDYDSVGE